MNIRNEYMTFTISIIFLIIIFYCTGLIKFTYTQSRVEIDFFSPIVNFRHEPSCSSLSDS